MALEIQSKEVIDKISEELKVQPALQIPRKIGEKIDLVYSVNPARKLQVAGGTVADATEGSIFTAAANKRTFLVHAHLSVAKDVVSDSVSTWLRCTPLGQAANTVFLNMRYEPITVASNLNLTWTASEPLEIEPGSAVLITNSTATASIDAGAVITYFETDAL